MKQLLFNMILCTGLAAGCATMKQSVIMGAGAGATAGMYVGAKSVPTGKKKNAAITAAVGAALGGLAGYFVHGGLEKRDERTRQEVLLNLEKFGTAWDAELPECNLDNTTLKKKGDRK